MKRIIQGAILTLTITLASFTSNAQSKIAYINSQELLASMPERTMIEEELMKHGQNLQNQMEVQRNEYLALTQDYQTNYETWSEAMQQLKMEEITDMEARIQKFQQTAQDDMARKEQELVAPLLDKAKQAVDEVAKLKGYDYVLDSSAGALVTYPEEHDLLKAVQSHLGITASE